MPRDTNGNTQPLPGTIVSTGDTILPSQHNPMVNDVYGMISQSLSRDGQGGMRSTLDMSGFRVINVGPATASTDAINLSQFQTGTPVGSVVDFAGSTAPATWLLCFGQAVSRTDYASLFAVIGTTFGAGNGSTTFNLPDARGRVSAGKDDMGGADAQRLSTLAGAKTVGGNGGAQTHSLVLGEIPAHDHSGATGISGSFTQTFFNVVANLTGTFSFLGSGQSGFANLVVNGPAHSHPIPLQGGNGSHNNIQPTLILNKIIKASY